MRSKTGQPVGKSKAPYSKERVGIRHARASVAKNECLAASSNAKEHLMRCGFCALLGRPNVGKSTLVNRLVGRKVSIVSPKPQTTRTRILGLRNEPCVQLIFVDTPGLSQGKKLMQSALRRTAGAAAADADVTLVVIEAHKGVMEPHEDDLAVLKVAQRSSAPIVLALNKVDLIDDKAAILPLMAAFAQRHKFAALVPVSAATGVGVDDLIKAMCLHLPVGPQLFPPEQKTDQAEHTLVAELVREQLLWRLQDEVPHSALVTITSFEDGYDRNQEPICRIEARIIVERDSQKAIVIGRSGLGIREIGKAARRNIERFLGCNVYLGLSAHVDARWTQKPDALRRYGLTHEATP